MIANWPGGTAIFLIKSYQQTYVPNSDNCGLYMLIDDKNQVVVGERFDASLEYIERCLEHIKVSSRR